MLNLPLPCARLTFRMSELAANLLRQIPSVDLLKHPRSDVLLTRFDRDSQHKPPSGCRLSAESDLSALTSGQGVPASWTPQDTLQMQRIVGNRGVQRLLARRSVTVSRSPAFHIQREPDGTGLEQAELSDTFVATGYEYWKKHRNRKNSITQYVDYLMGQVNRLLTSIGVTACKHNFKGSGGTHYFHRAEWTIEVDLEYLSKGLEPPTVGALSQDQAGDIAGTIYHEARHAEQAFRVARMLAGEGNIAETIVSELDMPAEVVAAAMENPLVKGQETIREFEEAKKWSSMIGGNLMEYRGTVFTYRHAAFEVYESMLELSEANFTTVQAKVKQFMDEKVAYYAPYFAAEYERLQMGQDRRKNDDKIANDINYIHSETTLLQTAWQAGNAAEDLAGLQSLKDPLTTLWLTLYDAYKRFPDEKDADKAGRAVEDKFKQAG